MNIERALDRRFFSYRSILGYYHWVRTAFSIIKNKSLKYSDRLWCLRHGFSATEYNLFGHEELRKNYRDYLSTKQYYKLHPINGMFSLWIDDKLTVKHVLHRYDEFMPKYYYDMEDGKALKLPDCPITVEANGYEGILELLK